MQRIEFANKKISTSHKNQKTEQQVVEESKVNQREVRSASLSTSRNVFYLLGSKDVYYVQSEHSDNIYYFCKFKPDVFEWCSCPDDSIRGQKCKHQFAIEYAIKKGTLRDIDKLPENAQRYPQVITTKDYREQREEEEDQYDF
jgi:predicted nucleic acid-binding Zn finger protein